MRTEMVEASAARHAERQRRRAFAAAVERFASTGVTLVDAYPCTRDATALWELIAGAEGVGL
ncbi:MAG: hypothetical protein M3022_02585 [Actinomycetota bacterium]|nr:hypothetical protein [Actinomycetota bacterium]